MHPKSKRLRQLLGWAVAQRATGVHWEEIASKLRRRVSTVENWPKRYSELWERLEYEEDRRQSRDTAQETVFILRNFFREEKNAEEKIKSANLLIRLLLERQKIDLKAIQAGLMPFPEDDQAKGEAK